MAGRSESSRFAQSRGGNVRGMKMKTLGVLALLGAGLIVAGCKSAPPLSKSQALAMIQARYDSETPQPLTIVVGDLGMSQGVVDKYWVETKRYPNGYWADFTLTPDGKKALKLANGGDEIQWRPDSPSDKQLSINVVSLVANHLKARNVGDITSDGAGGMTASYTEGVDLTGMPAPLQAIAQDPGNQLNTQRQADFALANGQWKLQSIQ